MRRAAGGEQVECDAFGAGFDVWGGEGGLARGIAFAAAEQSPKDVLGPSGPASSARAVWTVSPIASRPAKMIAIFGGGPMPVPSPKEPPMPADLNPIDKAKFIAAKRAVEFVEDGMKLGLGTGSTAAWMVRCLAERMREEGLRVIGVPTSSRTAELATSLGIPISTLDEVKWLDLTIDGADEFDANLNLIKGGGAALLQEKIVATASDQMIVIADAAKEVVQLGGFPLPIEVIPFGWQTTKALVEETLVSLDVLGRDVTLRMNGDRPLVTDESNYILDLHLNRIGNARQLALVLNQIPGVVENGLFIDICDIVVIGHADGRVSVRDINTGRVEDDRVEFAASDNIFADLE
jgi:ribose 5-phosphate isomerase A